MTRLARRIRRLEAARGACPACGGMGGLAIVLDEEPVPDEKRCRRCGRGPLVVRLVEVTREQWDEQQGSGQAHHAA